MRHGWIVIPTCCLTILGPLVAQTPEWRVELVGAPPASWSSVAWAVALNDDGVVDLIDLILALQVMVGHEPEEIYHSADANNDGVIGVADVIYLLHRVGGLR